MVNILALPIEVTASGAIRTLTQDTPAELAQSVAVILDTVPGDRRVAADFGTHSFLFRGVDVDELTTTVKRWDRRADATTVDWVATDLTDEVSPQTVNQHVAVTPATTPTVSPDIDQEA